MTEHTQRFNRKNFVNGLSTTKNTNELQRKFIFIKIDNTNGKLEQNTGSYISIINIDIYKHIGRPKLNKISKSARGISGRNYILRANW